MKIVVFVFVLMMFSVLSFAQTMAELNPDFENLLTAAMRPHNRTANEYVTNIKPLVLFHFSDIHGDKTELQRYTEFLGQYGKYFDDAVCTGDVVEGAVNSGFDYWGEVPGAEKILFIIGNHDFLRKWEGWDWNDRLSKKELYDFKTLEDVYYDYHEYYVPYNSENAKIIDENVCLKLKTR